MIDLPATYEEPAAHDRIQSGLIRKGCSARVAERAARDALLEAPFMPPDDEGWRWVCQRAREIASNLTNP